jgi:hypothetical protein
MNSIGIGLIIAGGAFVCSGLIFLLPSERKLLSIADSFEESRERIEYYLWQINEEEMREKRKE